MTPATPSPYGQSAHELIPPFRTEFTAELIEDALQGFREVLTSGQLVLGPFTRSFEQEFAAFVENRQVVAVNSGSTALEVILGTMDVRGQDVLVPSNTNFATARSVVAAGGRPVFYDCGLWAELADIEDRLTADTRAVIVVHIGGHISPELLLVASKLQERGIALIEDAAHAHGSTLGGRPAGTFGHAAFSFFPTKVITTGEGGMIVSDDALLTATARQYRDQGKDSSGKLHVVAGNSWRMTELGAVLGRAQLRTFAQDLRRRNEILWRYRQALKDVLVFPDVDPADLLSGHKAIATPVGDVGRDELRSRAKISKVLLAREVYTVPLHQQPIFAEYVEKEMSFPRTEQFCVTHLCLPLWTSMSDAQVDRIIEVTTAISR